MFDRTVQTSLGFLMVLLGGLAQFPCWLAIGGPWPIQATVFITIAAIGALMLVASGVSVLVEGAKKRKNMAVIVGNLVTGVASLQGRHENIVDESRTSRSNLVKKVDGLASRMQNALNALRDESRAGRRALHNYIAKIDTAVAGALRIQDARLTALEPKPKKPKKSKPRKGK